MPAEEHGIYSSSIARGFGELSSPNINLWTCSEPVWHLDNFTVEHQTSTSDQFCYPRELVPWAGIATSHHYHHATNFSTPSDEWPVSSPLDATCAECRDPPTPTITTLYPLSPHHSFVASAEALELKQETGRDNEVSFLVPPTSPEESPRSQKKRNRNRLAAAKCRKKAKRGVDDLQQKERDLLRENKMLNAEAGFLREEVLQLKSEILRHSHCDSDSIHHYIQKAAKEIGAQAEDNKGGIPVASAVR